MGHGRSRDEEVSQVHRELGRVPKKQDFCEKRERFSRERRSEVSDDPTLSRRLSHLIDASMFARIGQRVL